MALGRDPDARHESPVVVAPSDQRLYKVVHLPNGLSALLIHDPLIFQSFGIDSPGRKEAAVSEISDGEGEENGKEEDEGEEEEDSNGDEETNKSHGVDDEEFGGGDFMQDDNRERLSHFVREELDSIPKKRSHGTGSGEEGKSEAEGYSDKDEGSPTRKQSVGAPTKKAAAAMSVGVGSFSDPPDAQGLAHFLEHMLFMGSSKFPDENEYDSFLSKHGGSSNAFTETEYTCYHFDVSRKHLKPALNRFSQFFISPLAKAEAMDREVQAIESEFAQVLRSDSCRLLQVQCHTAHPLHPFHAFSWGNQESLGVPMANGVDMRGKMLELYKDHYMASRMKLAVLGGEALETMEEWVTELFGQINGDDRAKLSFRWTGPVWEEGKLYKLESVKDQHLLSLMWPFPCLESAYLKKPQDYILHLLGHEGSGSLLTVLKEKGWATAVCAGCGHGGYGHSSAGYMFNIHVSLTLVGLNRVFDVIGFFYQYVKMIRGIGPQRWIFEELQAMGRIEFRFAEEEAAGDYVVRLASNLHLYNEEHVIYGDFALEEWDAKLVSDLLAIITPANMRLDIVSTDFDHSSPNIQIEPWFKVPYIAEVVPQELMKIWVDPPHVDLGLHMPLVNEFIPHDFSIRAAKPGTDSVHSPRLLWNDSSVKLWYKLDEVFNTPRANIYFSITSLEASKTLAAHVLTELYLRILDDALTETIYLANVAKLEFSLSLSGDKFELKLYGFNEKLPLLALRIAEFFQTFRPTEHLFEAAKENLERTYRNTNIKPLKHSAYLRARILKQHFWDVDDKLECLMSSSLQDVLSFIPVLFEQTYLEALCHGNLSEEEALSTVNTLKKALVSNTFPTQLMPIERIYKLPAIAVHVLDAPVKNESEKNSVVEMYFQLEQDLGRESFRFRAMVDLFEQMISEPYFNQLRTKEQLGYSVDCGVRLTYSILGFCFRVQSSQYIPRFLHHRINVFVGSVQQSLKEMTDEEFTAYKEALIAEKMERDYSLLDETECHWEQILNKRYLFEAKKLEAIEIPSISKSDIIKWFSKYFIPGSPSCRKLSIHIWGNTSPRSNGNRIAGLLAEKITIITDFLAFKSGLGFYPDPV